MANSTERVIQAEAARRLGIEPQGIGLWMKRPEAPVVMVKGKRYCLWPAFPRWREHEMLRVARAEKKEHPTDEVDARKRKLIAEAVLAEIEVAKQEGKLVTMADANDATGEICDRLRAALVNVPSTYQMDLEQAGVAAHAAQGLLERIVDDLIGRLRDTVEAMDDAA